MSDDAPMTRTERLLALLVLDNMGTEATLIEKTVQLKRAGFENLQIGELLDISGPAVADNLYKAKQRGKKRTTKTATGAAKKRTPAKRATKRG